MPFSCFHITIGLFREQPSSKVSDFPAFHCKQSAFFMPMQRKVVISAQIKNTTFGAVLFYDNRDNLDNRDNF